jgi:hypothetical protein
MVSTVLPNGKHSFLPNLPTDGQLFVDGDFVQWSYDATNNVWEKCGKVDSIPLASSSSAGLLSPQDKALIDSTPLTPGGFGIIADTKLVLQRPDNPEGVISGDIKLLSDSLDIVCVGPDRTKLDCVVPPTFLCEAPDVDTSGLSFSLKEKFINSLFVDVSGPDGGRGERGLQGEPGRPGLSDGPQGLVGQRGDDVDNLCELTGIQFNDIEGLSDTAIVDLKVADDDGHGCKIVVTKAKLNLDPDKPADKLIATGLSRTLVFRRRPRPGAPGPIPGFPTPGPVPGLPTPGPTPNPGPGPVPPSPNPIPTPPNSESQFQKFSAPDPNSCGLARLDNWELLKAPGDNTPLNLNLVRLSDGSNDNSGQAVYFNATTTLNAFVGDIIAEYKKRLTKIDEDWGRQVKQYIEDIDDKARGILSNLADQLAMCEFNLPAIEYCITWVNCEGADPTEERTPEFPTPPAQLGACCTGCGKCFESTEGACSIAGGVWFGGLNCNSPNPKNPQFKICDCVDIIL